MFSKSHLEHLEDCSVIATYTNKLSPPLVVDNEIFCVSENGDIIKINQKGETEIVFTILGQPSFLAYKDG